MWPAFLTAAYYQSPITTAAAISFTSLEERDNPSASFSPVVWVSFFLGGLMVSWKELFPTGLCKKQCAHESWSGREGNRSIDLKVLNYFFSLSLPCPHQLITRRAKAGNVLAVTGVSGTESFSHCANRPEVSQPKPYWGEMLGEKSGHSAAAPSCLSYDPVVYPNIGAFGFFVPLPSMTRPQLWSLGMLLL